MGSARRTMAKGNEVSSMPFVERTGAKEARACLTYRVRTAGKLERHRDFAEISALLGPLLPSFALSLQQANTAKL